MKSTAFSAQRRLMWSNRPGHSSQVSEHSAHPLYATVLHIHHKVTAVVKQAECMTFERGSDINFLMCR
ncbi:MAG: hypothetical protein ABL861_03015 [Nitrosomonas sp.]